MITSQEPLSGQYSTILKWELQLDLYVCDILFGVVCWSVLSFCYMDVSKVKIEMNCKGENTQD